MRKLTLLTLALFGSWIGLHAQTDSATASKGTLTFSGYADAYYNHGFNGQSVGPTLWGPGANTRAFDINNKQFSLGMIQTKFVYTNSKFEFVGDLIAGPNVPLATVLQYGSVVPSLRGGAFGIKQLYGTWKATDKLSLTLGQFGTHIGYELIDAPLNVNYSLSNLFNNGPFFHTGAKAAYTINDKLAVMAGLVNNWDSFDDNNTQKSAIAQVYVKPLDGFNVYVNYIGGRGDYAGTLSTVINTIVETNKFETHLFDLTTGYQVTDKLYFGLNAAYGFYKTTMKDTTTEFIFKNINVDQKPKLDWGGVALYANYKINDVFTVAVRAEKFEDFYGVRYIGASNNSITLTVPITLADGHLIVKPEYRTDWTTDDRAIYASKTMLSTKQQTLGLAAIYKW